MSLLRIANLTRLFPAPFLLICVSCATPFPVKDLEEGMTAKEVRQVFGEPQIIRDEKVWIYTDEEQIPFTFPDSLLNFTPAVLLTFTVLPVIALLKDDVSWDDLFVAEKKVYLHFEGEKLARWQVGELEHGIETIVAIKVKKPRSLFGSESPSAVYFVRLEADSQYRHGRVFASNHESGGYAYLVNASPGRYAAIGAETYDSSSNPRTGRIKRSRTSYWYFPTSMIDETIVTVEPSGVAFMGEFDLSGNLRLDDADDTQTHYFNLFTGYARSNAVMKYFHKQGNWFVAEYRKDQSEMATQRFLESSRSLPEVGWDAVTTGGGTEDQDHDREARPRRP